MTPISIAFLPLTDCAILVAAKEGGFAEENGITLDLVREVSWATIRDRLIYRQVECAHMLAPLAVAVSLGLSQQAAPIVAPFKLSLNGNAIVVSSALAARMGGTAKSRKSRVGGRILVRSEARSRRLTSIDYCPWSRPFARPRRRPPGRPGPARPAR